MTTHPPPSDQPVEVLRGEPTQTELAALARAVVHHAYGAPGPDDPLQQWRVARRAALRARPEWSGGG
jgi:hypothetical protein